MKWHLKNKFQREVASVGRRYRNGEVSLYDATYLVERIEDAAYEAREQVYIDFGRFLGVPKGDLVKMTERLNDGAGYFLDYDYHLALGSPMDPIDAMPKCMRDTFDAFCDEDRLEYPIFIAANGRNAIAQTRPEGECERSYEVMSWRDWEEYLKELIDEERRERERDALIEEAKDAAYAERKANAVERLRSAMNAILAKIPVIAGLPQGEREEVNG